MKKLLNNKLYVGMIVELIVIVGLIIGIVTISSKESYAATIYYNGDNVGYDNTTSGLKDSSGNDIEDVQTALDELYNLMPSICYNGTCGKLSYRYWNNNFAGDSGANLFDSTHMPATNYATRALLEQNYGSSNFADNPVYIRSVLIDGNVVGHQACLWNNNKEFCLGPGYWAGTLNTPSINAGTQTKLKLQRDMQDALGVTIQDSSCYSSAGDASCYVGVFRCTADLGGYVDCFSDVTVVYCYVDGDGTASCSH